MYLSVIDEVLAERNEFFQKIWTKFEMHDHSNCSQNKILHSSTS